jgi:hypothetical protein
VPNESSFAQTKVICFHEIEMALTSQTEDPNLSGVRIWHIKGASASCLLFSFVFFLHESYFTHQLRHSVVPRINTLSLHHFHRHHSCAAHLRTFLSTTSTKILPTHFLDIAMNMSPIIHHHSTSTVLPNLSYPFWTNGCAPLAFEVRFPFWSEFCIAMFIPPLFFSPF